MTGAPEWARRMTNECELRGWSQSEAVRAMRVDAEEGLQRDGWIIRHRCHDMPS
jgi:hypothetical protein